MKVRNWFVGASSVGQAAVARFAEADLEEVRDVVKQLGYGQRLTLPQVEEVLAALTEDEDEEDTEEEDTEETEDEEARDDDDDDEIEDDEDDEAEDEEEDS